MSTTNPRTSTAVEELQDEHRQSPPADVRKRSQCIVLNISIKQNDRHPEHNVMPDIETFRETVVNTILSFNGIVSTVSNSDVIGIFAHTPDCTFPELTSAQCAEKIRDLLLEQKAASPCAAIHMRASINGGEVHLGAKLADRHFEAVGSGINASFQVQDVTCPMQISLTRRVKEKLAPFYRFITRMPTNIGSKDVMLYYLHKQIDCPCATDD